MALRVHALALVTVVVGCGGGGAGERDTSGDASRSASAPPSLSDTARRTDATTIGAAAAVTPSEPPARDGDQHFLRHMLDRYEGMITLAHDQMTAASGHAEHGTAVDPALFDASLDAGKLRMVAVLDSLYQDKHSPRATDAAGIPVGVRATSGASAPPNAASDHKPAQTDSSTPALAALTRALRAGVAYVDSARGTLRHREVRDLADSLRATQTFLLRKIDASPAQAR